MGVSNVFLTRLCLKTPSSGARSSGFSPGKDGETGDIGFIVDGAPDVHRGSQAENKPLEARSSFPIEPILTTYDCQTKNKTPGITTHRNNFKKAPA